MGELCCKKQIKHKNMKKALAFAQKCLDKYGNPKMSGDNAIEVVVKKCLTACGLSQKETKKQ